MKYIIRLAGEIVTKSKKVRGQFINQLAMNIRSACQKKGVQVKVERSWTRIYVRSDDEKISKVLTRVFGIQNFSKVDFETETDLELLVAKAFDYYRDLVAGKSFAVKAKRSGNIGFTSMDLNKSLGARLNTLDNTRVNLTEPDVKIWCEMSPKGTAFFHDVCKGAGGLPLGCQDRAVVLMSGGFDSPVAAWMMQRRGVKVDYVFCSLAGASYERSVLEIAKSLTDSWSAGSSPKFFSVDFEGLVDELKRKCEHKYVQVILKRLFYRAAEKIAQQLGASIIITGEAVGQVSSQTLVNLATIEKAITTPVLRPVVAFDKNDIIDLSRNIGTYDLSAQINEYCHIVTEKPSTACGLKPVLIEESKLDLGILDKAISEATCFELNKLDLPKLAEQYVMTDELRKGAILIDVRSEHLFENWHYPGARNIEAYEIIDNPKLLEKGQTYILYCPIGLQSAVAAEKLQAKGYDVYSFRGGVAELKKLATLGS